MTQIQPGEFQTARWTPTHARTPQAGQTVVFIAPTGEQVRGCYHGNGAWIRYATRGQPRAVVSYTPSMWREIR